MDAGVQLVNKRRRDSQTVEETRKVKKQKVEVITVCTWNIGHISVKNPNLQEKLGNILSLLKLKPDLLVLQEVNNKVEISFKEILAEVTKLGYSWDYGPKLETGSSEYVHKTGVQYEYYVVFYLSNKFSFSIKETTLIRDDNNSEGDFIKETELIEYNDKKEALYKNHRWTYQRPVVMRKLSLKNGGGSFYLGVVHTSPSYKVELTARNYVLGTLNFYGKQPWILAGDWYIKNDQDIPYTIEKQKTLPNASSGKKISSREMEELKKASVTYPSTSSRRNSKIEKMHESNIQIDRATEAWENFLTAHNCKLSLPNNTTQTNFPYEGKGMIADYFVTSTHIGVDRVYAISTIGNPAENLTQNNWESDHVPVFASFKITLQPDDQTQEMGWVKGQSIFPDSNLVGAMSNEPVLLNGMKVIFDQSIGVYPVTLESKEK